MWVTNTIDEARRRRHASSGSWGLVPTMGALHTGHLELVRHARRENDHVAVSIFVNPTQFAPGGDFDRYPRNLERDLEVLKPLGVELVFAPADSEMYPPGYQTFVIVEEVTKPLEGAHRPGHFRGVTTVVAKLFNVIEPTRAYFGQKDAQQVVVIRQMVRDLAFPVELVIGETVREPDGLALSSRNAYLAPHEREAATVLFRALSAARSRYEHGERSGRVLRETMLDVLAREPLAQVEYVSAADPITLQELEEIPGRALLSLAVRIGTTRLIDNLLVGAES